MFSATVSDSVESELPDLGEVQQPVSIDNLNGSLRQGTMVEKQACSQVLQVVRMSYPKDKTQPLGEAKGCR